MNAGMKLATVYVAGALLVAGCGQSNSGSAGTSPSQPAAAKLAESKSAAPKDASIKIKGLYIGMDIQTVPALLKEKLAGKNWIITDSTKGGAFTATDIYGKPESDLTDVEKQKGIGLIFSFVSMVAVAKPENFYIGISDAGGWLEASPDGKVTTIVFTKSLVNELFNAADMDASAFVKQFISAYNIPEMRVSDNLQSWTYTSPNGEKVTIDTNKSVMIEKVQSTQDLKQSFN